MASPWSVSVLVLGHLCLASGAAIVGSFGVYPGYTGDLSSVSGAMSVMSSDGVQTLSWSLSSVDSRCSEACTATNCCGVHIHQGKTCSTAADVGGHYWNSTAYATDPWLTVMYNASSSPSTTTSLAVATGLEESDILGRAMVIHDFTGGRIACGIISEATVSGFSAYPGYSGNLQTMGYMHVSSGFGIQTLSWIFDSGLDERCSETCTAANCCGVHIHVGKTCSDASSIGGHFWDSDKESTDPWSTVMYNTSGGMPAVTSGVEVTTYLDTSAINHRAMVIHDFTGARIACAQIMMPVSEALVSSWSLYPGSDSDLTVDGFMSVISSSDAMGTQTLSWSLSGLDPQCANTCTAANCCGVHIHVGTDCSDASTIGGHYWDSSDYATDPWLTVMYNSTTTGTDARSDVAVATGLSASDVLLRAMVIHDSTGARISCGIISLANVPSFAAYPGYDGNLATAGVMKVSAVGTTQTLSWIFTAGLDTQCTGSCTATNCCGVHIHAGKDCTDASTIGGHWYDSTALSTDPWLTITYDASTMPSVMKDVAVVTGKSPSEIEGRTMVIHDFTGSRIACGTISLDAADNMVMNSTSSTNAIDIDGASGFHFLTAFLLAFIVAQ